MIACAVFYLGLSVLVFVQKQVPQIKEHFGWGS